MKLKVGLSIGYGQDRCEEIEIDDEELEGLSRKDREKIKDERTREWAENYIDFWHEDA